MYLLAYPLIYILLEEVRNRFPFGGFGWVRIAFTQADAPYAKVAAIGGATALSAAVVLIALFIFHILHREFSLLPLLLFLIVLVSVNTSVIGSANVLMIQGNVPQLGLDFNSRAKAVFNNHFERTQIEIAKDPNVDFILWQIGRAHV